MILANFIRRFSSFAFGSFAIGHRDSLVPNPRGGRRLRKERPTRNQKKPRKERRKRMSQMESGRRGGAGIARILIPTYPAIKLMNLIRPD